MKRTLHILAAVLIAAAWLISAAPALADDPGGAEEQYRLAMQYIKGQGVAKDMRRGADLLIRAAGQGHVKAAALLGFLCQQGGDNAQAVKWLTVAAEQGHAKAQAMLGALLYQGKGVPQDLGQAAKWLTKAAEQGEDGPRLLLGSMYANGQWSPQDPARLVGWVIKEAEKGETRAQALLGIMYMNGRGVPRDPEQAVKWLKAAAEKGDVKAVVLLGSLYLQDHGTPQDHARALPWLTKAAEAGDKRAQFTLGSMYALGKGTPPDGEKALHWLEKSAAQGYPLAGKMLEIINKGIAGELEAMGGMDAAEAAMSRWDFATAVRILRPLAAGGNAQAQSLLGVLCMLGAGMEPDLEQAAKWLTKAAEAGDAEARLYHRIIDNLKMSAALAAKQGGYEAALLPMARKGNATAQLAMGTGRYFGIGMERDRAEAIRWLRLSAEQGEKQAQLMLGAFLAFSGPDPAGRAEAVKWLKTAARAGMPAARKWLEMLGEEAPPVAATSPEREYPPAPPPSPADAKALRQALTACTRRDFTAAASILEPMAERGVAQAQSALGSLYVLGLGVDPDLVRARNLFLKATRGGMDHATTSLGGVVLRETNLDYARGNAGELRAQAEGGNPQAQRLLGYLYYYGPAGTRDYTQAAQWCRRAAAKGDRDAQSLLGMMLLVGRGLPADAVRAERLISLASMKGNTNALYVLALLKYQSAEWPIIRGSMEKMAAQDNPIARELLEKIHALSGPEPGGG